MSGQLYPIDTNIWIVEGTCVDFYGFSYPTRSVIVRLQDESLWVWSPIALTSALKREVAKLGRPRHLVSPNKLHHLFLQTWQNFYPDAILWGPASTMKKCSHLSFQPALENSPPACWKDEFDQAWFRGSFAMDEIVFFHRSSRTAILADLSENFDQDFLQENWRPWQRRLANAWGIVEGKGYAPLEWRLSFVRRGRLRAARDKVLSWNPERVVMAHGKWQSKGGRQYLENAFRWIG